MDILKIPFTNGKTSGCEKAGEAILKSLECIGMNEKDRLIDVRLLNVEKFSLDNLDLNSKNDLTSKNILKHFEKGNKTIFLGGDHSISYFLAKSFLENCISNERSPCLIVFDSRPNCNKCSEESPKNDEWLRHLIEEGFPAENIFLVGVRNSSYSETAFLKQNGIKVMRMNQILENREDSCDILMEFANGKELYVSIDVGVLDSIFVPGVFSSEMGGLSMREFLYFIQRFNLLSNLKAVDIVEVNPEKDEKGLCASAGAKILSELI